jgi:hypothetical protein
MEPTGMRRHRLIGDQPGGAKLMGNSFVKLSPQEGPESAHFCSMKITEDVRK